MNSEPRITEVARVGSFEGIRSMLSGRCWIYGISQVGIDPTDPFSQGFSLPDIWGGPIPNSEHALGRLPNQDSRWEK
uniref:Uncharacterized protein n=1 Tax=uncultured alpha proteobacterium EF100_102A06 TaxID=710799 RepID=E0Y241_9PROT|nr:hypothetical protein [uncultured alpha proteobacterium EF100_102A06]